MIAEGTRTDPPGRRETMNQTTKPMKIAVAMSGGVDSSTVAALLKEQGHEVLGITMTLFDRGYDAERPDDARLVADFLGIPHHRVDFSAEFARLIVADFRSQYDRGETPNPCVRCNRFVKFGLLLDAAHKLGADVLATGHYVRTTTDAAGVHHLRKAACAAKDQSYFLYTLTQPQLARVLFPLGDLASKDEVRRLAAAFGLPVAAKGDSQEICFVPGDDYIAFLEEAPGFAPRPGEIIHVDGTVVGRHHGIHRYTVGQRRGLGVAWRAPLYVVALDPRRNAVIVGEQELLFAAGLVAAEASWTVAPPAAEFAADCKIRYRHQPVPCRVRLLADDRLAVRFATPQKSVTPGQAVVFYRDDEVLGGGRIVAPLRGEEGADAAEDQ